MLRMYRKQAGMTQEQLGFEAGVERNYVSMLELGQRQPTVGTLFSLAKALQVRPSILVALLEERLEASSNP
ncbi:helix-turn-helix transcriptional regulator [Comamonas odontotermitis]|nr:helix-turn-helix transcriptional regulator [Comamonas odontotermitis]